MTTPLARAPAEHVEGVLCVLAHPDDVDFGSAGTVATWTAAGTEVVYCIVTDGDAGGFDDTPRDQTPILRRAEQQAAAATTGVTDVLDRKLAALRCHVTQVGHNPDLEQFVTGWMSQTAKRFGLPDGRLAEAFHVVHTA